MPFLKNGDSGGVRTRDFLDENQTSWTTRRRNREVIITFFGYGRKSLVAVEAGVVPFTVVDWIKKMWVGVGVGSAVT